MFPDLEKVKIFIRPGFTDMRKAINGLSILVSEEMESDPFEGSLFLFCNRTKKILKIIYWDRNGFCLWQKRLEKHRFPWPDTKQKIAELDQNKLSMLLSGIDFFKAHKNLDYSQVS